MFDNISIITTHFFDFDWTELLINNITNNSEVNKLKEILVINQDRNQDSAKRLESLHPLVRVLEYPISEPHFEIQGHDHAMVLNQAVREIQGTYMCIFDSDAHPINSYWISSVDNILEHFDAVLALVPGSVIDTHPCFMIMKKDCVGKSLSFDENLFTTRVDTGRLVGKQLIESGRRVYFAPPTKAFNGMWGNKYLNSIYHHGKGSFNGAMDDKIRGQVNWRNKFFKQYVIEKHRYELTFTEYLLYRIQKDIRKKFNIQ